MSLWRKEASRRLPELQASIASSEVKRPSDLWMQLCRDFQQLCHQEPPPVDLLSRIWQYARWCAEQRSAEVQFAVVAHFFENIEDTRCHREVLLKFVSRDEYETVCGLRTPPNPKGK